MLVLRLTPDLVSNSHAKQILETYESEQELFATQQSPKTGRGVRKKASKIKKDKHKKDAEQKKWSCFIFWEEKTGTTLFKRLSIVWKPERIINTQQSEVGKIKSHLETKPFFLKYLSIRLKFSRLKVILKDINQIWSLDLTHIDKLADYNRTVKYLLVAVDRLSQYLRVEPMKTKYATEAAEASKKKWSSTSNHKKCGLTMAQNFSELSKLVWQKKNSFIEYLQWKKSAFAKQNNRSLKNIIWKYLEEKWTYSYIDKLYEFNRTIKSRNNRVTKLATNKVKKRSATSCVFERWNQFLKKTQVLCWRFCQNR